ncbi:MAG: hypothetical protein ABJR05_00600 [Balneola sp.]
MRWPIILSLLIINLVFSSCTPSYNPLREYPAFKKQAKEFDHAILAVDVVVIENSRRRSTIDYDRQITVAEAFQTRFLELLTEKDIEIDNTFYASSGLFLAEGSQAEVADLVTDSTTVDTAKVIDAPFYRSLALQDDPLMEERIMISMQDSAAWHLKEEQLPYVPKNLLFVCRIEGVNTPIGKQMGQAFLTALATLGNAYAFQASYLLGSLYIFDLDTGRLLWYDERSTTGDLANHRTAKNLANLFSRKIPPEYRRSYK